MVYSLYTKKRVTKSIKSIPATYVGLNYTRCEKKFFFFGLKIL